MCALDPGEHVGATLALRAQRLAIAACCATLALSCSHLSGRDETGIPVELNRVDNVEAAANFLEALSARRRETGGAEPSVAPTYQSEMRRFAEELQAGKSSLTGALLEVRDWARGAYRREVETYAVDCSSGAAMSLPTDLTEPTSVAIAYAAAHFRLRSSPSSRCVILVVRVTGSDVVKALKL